jgi:hypothetical protein
VAHAARSATAKVRVEVVAAVGVARQGGRARRRCRFWSLWPFTGSRCVGAPGSVLVLDDGDSLRVEVWVDMRMR